MVVKAISTAALSVRQWPEPGAWTYQDYQDLPDDGYRYEIICGELYMSPAPNTGHQLTSGELEYALQSFVRQRELGTVLHAPCDLILPGGSPVQPDILFVSKTGNAIITPEAVRGAPDLIIEILSPSNADHDRERKYNLYEQAGVVEYWLVDPQARTIEIFGLANEAYTLAGKFESGQTAVSQALSGFTVQVDEVLV